MWINPSDGTILAAISALKSCGQTKAAEDMRNQYNTQINDRKQCADFIEEARESQTNELEFDDEPAVSLDDPKEGAFIMCWKWIDVE